METYQTKRSSRMVLAISTLLFLSTLPVSTHCTQYGCDGNQGWGMLLMGWMGILTRDLKHLVWYANPLLFASWAVYKKVKISLGFSTVALLIGCTFMTFDSVTALDDVHLIVSLKPGYWLWLSSMAVMVMGNSWMYYTNRVKQ